MQTMFADERFWLVFLFIPPLLTMRLFAEERSSGTLEMLMTAPLRDWQVVLSKYLACLAFYVVLWLPTLIYLPALLGAQTPEFNNVWTLSSLTFVAGLGGVLVGLLLLLPRLGTTARLVSTGADCRRRRGGRCRRLAALSRRGTAPAGDPGSARSVSGAVDLCGHVPGRGDVFGDRPAHQQPGARSDGGGHRRPGAGSALHRRRLLAAGAGRRSISITRVYFFSVPLHFDRAFTRGLMDTPPADSLRQHGPVLPVPDGS